jgi:hypothetical protein
VDDVAPQCRAATGRVQSDRDHTAQPRCHQYRREERGVAQQYPDVGGLVRIEPSVKRRGDIGAVRKMLAPRRIRAVIGVNTAIIDLAQGGQ